MSPSLPHPHVVVTRPAHQAESLCRQLATAGFPVTRLPVMAIAWITPGTIEQPPRFARVVVTSANAVEGLRQLALRPVADSWIAIGPKTAHALANLGIPARHSSASHNSEAALQLPELQQLAQQPVLILKGEGGRELLADTLRDRGAMVTEWALYRRVLAAPESTTCLTALQQGEIFTATSVETLENLLTLLAPYGRDALLQKTVLAGGERIASAASELGFSQPPIVAASPADSDMLAALRSWHQSGQQP